MIHDGTDHTKGIRPSAGGVTSCAVGRVVLLLPMSVPVGYCGINLRHNGQDSRMVQCYGCYGYCIFV